MSDVIIFKLKEEPGFINASSFKDEDLSSIPEDAVCISFENAEITDEGILGLPELNKLRCIDLDATQITDKAMEIISQISSLEEIWIEGTKITDEGFKKLALLPHLSFVSFWDTDISKEAFNYVIKRLPNLKFGG